MLQCPYLLHSLQTDFPYDVTFTPWLNFEDQTGEKMDVDKNQDDKIISDIPASNTASLDRHSLTPSQAINLL